MENAINNLIRVEEHYGEFLKEKIDFVQKGDQLIKRIRKLYILDVQVTSITEHYIQRMEGEEIRWEKLRLPNFKKKMHLVTHHDNYVSNVAIDALLDSKCIKIEIN